MKLERFQKIQNSLDHMHVGKNNKTVFYKYLCPDVECEKQLCNKGVERGPQQVPSQIKTLWRAGLVGRNLFFRLCKSCKINGLYIARFGFLREAVRIFRESKISDEKSKFFLFCQNIPFCELVSKKILLSSSDFFFRLKFKKVCKFVRKAVFALPKRSNRHATLRSCWQR